MVKKTAVKKSAKPPSKQRRLLPFGAEASEWRSLAQGFLAAAGPVGVTSIQLLYKEGRDQTSGNFDLYCVEMTEYDQEKDRERLRWVNPVLESACVNLVTRALLLAGRSPGDRLWWTWAEFLIDSIPYHQESLEIDVDTSGDAEADRLSYLKGSRIYFVPESVMACHQWELRAMGGNPPQRPPELVAYGLKALRERLQLSQESFAESIKVSTRTVQYWEAEVDPRPISEQYLRRICEVHKCKTDDVLGSPAKGNKSPE
jgi:DNA-binding transcriptional regulator YiaG